MKNNIITLLLFLLLLSCQSSSVTLVSSAETDKEFIVFAQYTKEQQPRMQTYLQSLLNKKISIKEDSDFPVILANGDTAKLTTSADHLELTYNKKNAEGIADMEKLKEDIRKLL